MRTELTNSSVGMVSSGSSCLQKTAGRFHRLSPRRLFVLRLDLIWACDHIEGMNWKAQRFQLRAGCLHAGL